MGLKASHVGVFNHLAAPQPGFDSLGFKWQSLFYHRPFIKRGHDSLRAAWLQQNGRASLGKDRLFNFFNLLNPFIYRFILGREPMKLNRLKNLITLGLCLLSIFVVSACSKPLPVLGELPSFSLQDQNGNTLSANAFEGKVLAANFVFTSCAGTCPLLTERMKKVQHFIESTTPNGEKSPYHIVSFSVDPERDTPTRMQKYMKDYEMNPEFWSFLTGPYQSIEEVVVRGFKMAMGKVALGEGGEAAQAKVEDYDVIHGEKFILVDQSGKIRGYFDASESGLYQLTQAMAKLAKQNSQQFFCRSLRKGNFMSEWGYRLATLNASLNGMAAILLFAGWRAIRRGNPERHRVLMISAFSLSCVFLISYLIRVAIDGTHRYPGVGWDKTFYLVLLISHVILAALVPFLAFRAIYLAIKQRFAQHQKIAAITFPIWMYVSITGVIIYLMLYQLH